MDFFYENLNPDTFQQFCQSLLIKEYPDTSVFPVGQKDGGRDGGNYLPGTGVKEFIIFQVKFALNPSLIKNPYKWLADTIEGEAHKIENLIARGAKKYVLLTNVKGTAALESGSIDKTKEVLKNTITIDSQCWWRDDLSRRLDNNISLKWSYSQILSGKDIVNLIIKSNLTEKQDYRESVIRAYLIDQYENEKEVKFKQIELQNNLLDLFTDIPITLKQINGSQTKSEVIQRAYNGFHHMMHWKYVENREDGSGLYDENVFIGAASLLLGTNNFYKFQRVLLEGGPGQGKSTITQFICQIHRIRLLNKSRDIQNIRKDYLLSPAKLPIKIDLRDFATWLAHKNPYQEEINEEYFKTLWAKTLESFLEAHILHHSKIKEFRYSDITSVFKLSAVLIVFDGFDEVADIAIRNEMVEIISRGVTKISDMCLSLQVIITSRPAAFANSAGFSNSIFPHFELKDLNDSVRSEYIDKWVLAKKISVKEGRDIKSTVVNKLSQPHLKDLARSPMQLAILISLINTRGVSLPNKRTALYDSYIDLFFDRESEKNATIRDNRDIIINLHRHLAWVLHSEAELNGSSGSIKLGELKQNLGQYLLKEGHKTELMDELFTAIQERVCAIVSRVQGTFEFEVQPLREYFCARHLYETAPYSPSGNAVKGTLPDRFEALSNNPYWLNVTRFYAGCFNKGELPMLILKLEELVEKDDIKYTSHPRLLSSMLLSDWVFTQYPKLMKSVVGIILNGVGVRALLSQYGNQTRESITLPDQCGREELIEECFAILMRFPSIDYAIEVIGIINANRLTVYEDESIWLRSLDKLTEPQLDIWLSYGYRLGLLFRLNHNTLDKFFNDLSFSISRVQILLNSNQIEYLESKEELFERTSELLLSGDVHYSKHEKPQKSITKLGFYLCSLLYRYKYRVNESHEREVPLIARLTRWLQHESSEENSSPTSVQKYSSFATINDFIAVAEAEFEKPSSEWLSSIEPWDALVSKGINCFGQKNIFSGISSLAAGIKSFHDTCEDATDMFDDAISMPRRARYARLKSGNIKWWEATLADSTNDIFSLCVFFSWASPKTLTALIFIADEKVRNMSQDDFDIMYSFVKKSEDENRFNLKSEKLFIEHLASETERTLSVNTLLLLVNRLSSNGKNTIYNSFFYDYKGLDKNANVFCMQTLVQNVIYGSGDTHDLKKIRQVYSRNSFGNNFFRLREDENALTHELAINVIDCASEYPRELVVAAEHICRAHYNTLIVPVGKIAIEDDWFS